MAIHVGASRGLVPATAAPPEASRAATINALLRAARARWQRPVLVGLSFWGAVVGVWSVLVGFGIGMWPPHDSSAIWLAGRHILEGAPVYAGDSWFLAFVYTPPVAVLVAPMSVLDHNLFSLLFIGLEIAALRYITGSWLVVGLLGWVPASHYEFVAGNVNVLMAATIYAALTGRRFAGVAVALFSFAKLAPLLVLVRANRRQWLEFLLTTGVLLAISLPWLPLWPDWIARLSTRGADISIVPFVVRLPVAVLLLLYRRPWAVAASTALATPVFYEHSLVLLIPAVRLWWDARRAGSVQPSPRRSAAGGLTSRALRGAVASATALHRSASASVTWAVLNAWTYEAALTVGIAVAALVVFALAADLAIWTWPPPRGVLYPEAGAP